MALGKVVVGSRGGSFEELIDDRVSGFLVSPDDSRDLLGRLDEVLNMDEREMRRVEAAAQKRMEDVRPELAIPKLLGFYGEHLSAGQPGHAVTGRAHHAGTSAGGR